MKNPTQASCRRIFRAALGVYQDFFVQNIPYCDFVFTAETLAIMLAIKIAASKHWNNIWIETDSQLVQLVFNDKLMFFFC